jgi:hypothetical protein
MLESHKQLAAAWLTDQRTSWELWMAGKRLSIEQYSIRHGLEASDQSWTRVIVKGDPISVASLLLKYPDGELIPLERARL